MERTSDDVANSENNAAAEPATAEQSVVDARSNYGTVPGAELPVAVYWSVFIAFIWVVVAAWIAFANDADAELSLGMATVLTIVFFTLPVLIRMTANSHADTTSDRKQDFLASPVETATDTLTGASAWLQIALIPVALALAATLIGVTSVLVH
jgi:hypothetical protein